MLILHIAIALVSVVTSGVTYARPAKSLFRLSYALAGGTLVTGTYLVLVSPSHLPTACLSGLAYLALVGVMLAAAHAKSAAKA